MLEMLTITPPLPSRIMRSAASRPHRNTPVRFTSMTACHCSRLILPLTAPSLALTSSASRTMPALLTMPSKRPKSATMRSKVAHDFVLARDVGAIAACLDAVRLAGGERVRQILELQVDQRQVRAVRGEILGEGTADAARGAGDGNGLALQSPWSTDPLFLTWGLDRAGGGGCGGVAARRSARLRVERREQLGLHAAPHLHVLARELGERRQRCFHRLGHLRLHGALLLHDRAQALLEVARQHVLHRDCRRSG